MVFVRAGLFTVTFGLSMIKAGNNFSFENVSLENKTAIEETEMHWNGMLSNILKIFVW